MPASRSQTDMIFGIRNLPAVLLCTGITLLSVACSTTDEVSVDQTAMEKNAGNADTKREDYAQMVQNFTRQGYLYSGFVNVFQLHATILNEEIVARQLRHLADQYGWIESTYRSEREKAIERTKSSTEFFLSFFAAEMEYNGLDENKSVWKIYLETSGQRIEGTVKKWKAPAPEIESIFPFFTRWHSPYRVSFAIPTSQVQGSSCRLVIQGPLGAQTMDFPGVVYTGVVDRSGGEDGVTF